MSDHPSEWRDKILFIDGLDETRVRCWLTTLAQRLQTRFAKRLRRTRASRTSVYHAGRRTGWGQTIRSTLESVSPDSKVTVLRLNPLTDSVTSPNILNDSTGHRQMLRTFIKPYAQEKGVVYELLKNPLDPRNVGRCCGPKAVEGGQKVAKKLSRWPAVRWSASTTRNIKRHRSQTVHLHPTSSSTPLGGSAPFN